MQPASSAYIQRSTCHSWLLENKDEAESHEAKVILGPNHSSETKTSHPSNSANVTFLGWWVHVTRTQRLYKWPPTIGVQKVTLNHLDCVELFQINGTSKSISTDGPGMAVRAHVLLNQSLPVQKSNKKHLNSKGIWIIKYLYCIYVY